MLTAIIAWINQAAATWLVAGLLGGVLILVAERLKRRPEPSDADVRRTADRYRSVYGENALAIIGDHMLAARFAPDSRHSLFLRRVSAELRPATVIDRDQDTAMKS